MAFTVLAAAAAFGARLGGALGARLGDGFGARLGDGFADARSAWRPAGRFGGAFFAPFRVEAALSDRALVTRLRPVARRVDAFFRADGRAGRRLAADDRFAAPLWRFVRFLTTFLATFARTARARERTFLAAMTLDPSSPVDPAL